jgi:hypothetical protein
VPLAVGAAAVAPAALSRAAWRALGLGLALATAFTLIPFTRILFSPLITIVHELGHAATAWAFGYPAIPAFDFSYGGGVTAIEEDRVLPILAGAYLLAGYAAWRVRRHWPTLAGLGAATWLFSWLALTDWHEAVILAMGHGTELIIAGVFLYRAMSGDAVLRVDERPAYAMAAFVILLHDAQFGWSLITSDEARAGYQDAKGGGAWMDFSQLELYFRTSVATLAQWFLVACAATVLLAWLAHRYQDRLAQWWDRAVH